MRQSEAVKTHRAPTVSLVSKRVAVTQNIHQEKRPATSLNATIAFACTRVCYAGARGSHVAVQGSLGVLADPRFPVLGRP